RRGLVLIRALMAVWVAAGARIASQPTPPSLLGHTTAAAARQIVLLDRATLTIVNKGILAGATGLEPAASCVTGRRSNQLNYAPALRIVAFRSAACQCIPYRSRKCLEVP